MRRSKLMFNDPDKQGLIDWLSILAIIFGVFAAGVLVGALVF